MSETLSLALQITVIGMALIFAAIILLWAVMVVLVRLTSDPVKEEAVEIESEYDEFAAAERQRKARAAAIAVTAALAHETESMPHLFPLPPTAIVSAWQAVRRSDHLRKDRGRR